MSKYAEDQAYLDYFKKKNEPNMSKLDYIIMKMEKIEKLLLKTVKKEEE